MKCVYEGEFVKGKFSGYGEYKSKYSTYFGTWLKGFKEGKGEEKWIHGDVYIGEYHHGIMEGQGKMIYDSEGISMYEGDWIDNRKFGWGVRHYPSG